MKLFLVAIFVMALIILLPFCFGLCVCFCLRKDSNEEDFIDIWVMGFVLTMLFGFSMIIAHGFIY